MTGVAAGVRGDASRRMCPALFRGLVGMLVCVFGGCGITRVPADPDAARAALERAAPLPPDVWPDSDKEGLPTVKFGGRKPDGAGGWVEGGTKETGYEPLGGGWIRSERIEFHSDKLSVVSDPWLLYAQWRRDGQLPEALDAAGERTWWDEGTLNGLGGGAPFSLAFGVSGLSGQKTPPGVLIHISGIAPGLHDGAVTAELERRGWVVIHTWGWEYTPPKRAQESEEARAAQGSPGSLPRLDTQVDRFAAESDEAAAMFADGVAAALEWVDRESPRVAGVPVVVTGYSLGAMLTPTVAARLGDRVRAVVLVGGGANVVGIAATTDVGGGFLTIHEVGGRRRLSGEELEHAEPRYLERSRLDPYHTAPLLADRPVLVLQAARDGYVLPRYGDLLWERLGRPERWVRNSGHVLLFYWLDDSAVEVADWVERSAASAPR